MNTLDRVIELNQTYTDILRNYNEGIISWVDARDQIEALNFQAASEGVPFKVETEIINQVVGLDTTAYDESSSSDDE